MSDRAALPQALRAPEAAPESPASPAPWWHRVENGVSVVILSVMVVLPVVALLVRWTTGASLAWANLWVQALNLWIAFAGGALAARSSTHLALSTGTVLGLSGRAKDLLGGFTAALGTAITALLAYASADLIRVELASTQTLAGGVPMWVIQLAMPIGFVLMAVRLAIHSNRTLAGRLVALAAVGLACALALVPPGHRDGVVWGGAALLLVGTALGAPLYTAMGGMAMLLFYGLPDPVSISAVPAEAFRIVADPTLASLPMFTLAGYLLAEGGSSKRLVHLFQVAFGWLPGGVAAAAILVSAFFTTFTGASGVTILALGGLLYPALRTAGYTERFSIGLIAASGSIGLLFPPSLPVILYGITSHVPINQLFLGGLVPGVIIVATLVGMAVFVSIRDHGMGALFKRDPTLSRGERAWRRTADIGRALWAAKFESLLPVIVLVGLFGGYMTIFEAAAVTAVYAFLIEAVIHRDLHPLRQVPKVMVECATVIGGVFVILGMAIGLTSYLVDAEVPVLVSTWVQAHVANRLVFILLLNLVLLAVGCLMDIYSAIMVVVPLIVPVASVFGLHPVHLGILFLANLELGYLTPPVGLNLFLASFRFKIPLTRVYRYAVPFLIVMTMGVLLISYVPIATTWALDESAAAPAPDFFSDELAAEELAADPALGAGGETAVKPGVPANLDINAMLDELNAPEPAAAP